MAKNLSAEKLKKRYARLAQQVAKLGPVLQGTITERSILRQDPANPAGPKKSYGPYYQWTFKREGKTVTVNLSSSQLKVYQQAIDNHRKLEQITQEMRELSLQLLEQTTEGVKKRKQGQQDDS